MLEKISMYKNPFVGLYASASDKYALVASPHKFSSSLKKILKSEIINLDINYSLLTGLFSVLNSNGCILPFFAGKEEKIVRSLGLNTFKLSHHPAVSNNILANDTAAIVNPDLTKGEVKGIEDALGVEVVKRKIGDYKTVGATSVVTNRGLFLFNNSSDEELRELEEIFSVKGLRGTSNMGSFFNGLSIIANSKGVAVGSLTSGVEAQRIYEALLG